MAPTSPQPAPTAGPAGGSRYAVAPSNKNNNYSAQRAAQTAAAAQQAVAAASAARNAAASAAASAAKAQQNASNQQSYGYGYSPYGYGYSPYGYSPYGYSPYGYSYPPGTIPYVLGYDPSGTTYLAPLGGGYPSYYPGYQYPYYRNPYLGYGYPGAVFAPAGQLFGLGPIQQLMGVGPGFQQPQANGNGFANGNPNVFANGNGNAANVNANAGVANNNNAGPNAAQPNANPPAGNPPAPVAGGKALELAWKFITFGDAHFGDQKYNDALDRYRHAARECPTLGDAWFRQGFALAALGRYDQAAKAMRRGLEEKADWVDNNFRLSDLYGEDSDEKKRVVDKMVKAAEAQPTNADVAFVVGVHLFCDGKQDQAAPFFHRAAQILGSDADVKSFLAKGR